MELEIKNEVLEIKLNFWEKVFSLKGSFEIPLEQIIKARAEEPESSWKDLRLPGTHLPGVIKAGSYSTKRGREFWYLTRKGEPLIIELKDNKYKRLVLEIKDAQLWMERINRAIK